MSDTTRSEQACPACGQHMLAIDEPPHIDVMGIQAYSDMLGMGDVQQRAVLGIICLACGTRWRDKAAFDRNEPEAARRSMRHRQTTPGPTSTRAARTTAPRTPARPGRRDASIVAQARSWLRLDRRAGPSTT